MNPVGTDGRTLTSKCCGSLRYLIANCPDTWGNQAKVNVTEDEHAVLFTGYNKDEIARLGADARNCAILDSACSSTICGKIWLDGYLKSLDKEDNGKVCQTDGVNIFKFGGGTWLKSEGEYSIPAVIAGKQVTIKTDMVNSDIPLLPSRTEMKSAVVKMDLEHDRAEIFGQDVILNLTSSGHYCIPIDKTEKIPVETACAVNLDDIGEDERYRILLKLHRQLAHPSKKRLVAFLKDAGVWKADYLEVLTDNGGEFNSDEMREVESNLNIQVCTTAGESPLQNGLCESVHAVTYMMLTKLEDEPYGADSETLPCWANMARNCLQMWNGFSSHQLVFGTKPNLLGITTDKLPALDDTTTIETFAKHLNTLHASRKAFIDTEANERIRQALRTKVRAAEQRYLNGDLVFYKCEGREKWLGPGKVVFHDGKVVFIRHGSVFVRMSPNRLCKISPLEYDKDDNAHEIVSNEKDDAQRVHKDSGDRVRF